MVDFDVDGPTQQVQGAGSTCTPTSTPTSTIAATYGNIGHVYITGDTTSKVPTSLIASVVPGWSCANPLAAASTQAGPIIVGPTGLPVAVPGGTTIPAGCTTALITQSPFNNNVADVSLCPYPIRFDQPNILGKNCNFSAFVGILDGALLTAPVTGPPSAPAPVGNQIEYWAYYSAPNASTVSNALAIDTNPTTLTSVYSLGTYQQMYITGSTTLTGAGGGGINQLPVTYNANATVNEIFTSYNVGTTGGGGVGGWQPNDPASTTFNTDGYVARFNANGLAASSFGGQGATLAAPAVSFPNMGYGFGETLPPTQPNDHSFLIHTPQFNFGEFIFSLGLSADGSSNANTAGNAIAVDPTRAALIGGVTNVKQTACTATTTGTLPCQFTTTNFLGSTPSGAQNNGGNDGWVSVLFFNDILTDAASQSTANPFLQPGFPQLAPQSGTTAGCQPGGILDGKCSYIQTTPAPFGPTFDFAISDPSTQTQSFRVLLTGQTAGQLLTQTPWYVPLDPRSGVSNATLDNNLPGSGIAYYLPCIGVPPGNLPHGTLVDSLSPLSVAPDSPGYYNNAYPAPGSPYGPQSCNFPEPSALYEALPMLFSGWPGLTAAQANKTLVTPGWLLVTQDINPGVVRLQLDRRAAAGLLEGTYVAQFLVNTYDSQTQSQWPPCGPKSSLNPFGPTGTCTNPLTPLPADNVSILVTVRLIVRPSLFLSRNSGILTGVTSSLAANPLFGPQATITLQDGTSKVPDWYFTGATNDTAAWPAGAPAGLGTIFGAGFPANANAGPPTCVPGGVVGTTVANVIPIVPQLGNPANPVVIPNPPGVTIPCPISATAPATTATAIYGAAAYGGNGPGDLSDGPIGTAPRMTFLYDLGTVLTPTPAPLTVCNIFANDSTNNQIANECNLAIEQNLAPSRPDQPVGVLTFNASWEGGQDPLTQRNDATIHDYYIEAEGGATLSVAAINCTYWNSGPQGHVNAVGNWLGVQIGGVNVNAAGAPSPSAYTPICTDLSPTTVGTLPAPATIPLTPLNADDGANPGAIGGRQIVLDFFAKAFSGGCLSQAASAANGTTTCTLPANSVGPRSAMNGIPTGLYTATVYVWSTRAKNSVPGYCLGSDFAVDGGSPTICAPSSASVASSTNPNPEVVVTGQQFFNVSLSVFDTTQTIQITPNSCPTGGVTNGVTEFATIGGISENLFTGNITPPYGPGSFPNYANFGANASQLVEWSLLPFQTTGTNITGCTGPGGTTPQGLPCPNPLAPNAAGGDASGGNTAMNIPVPLPQGVVVAPQTLAQYNACQLPTGTFLGVAINGMQVPGVGQLVQTGPLSQTTFIPSANNTNNLVTIYACRPTIAPAWLNSVNYPGNNVFIPGSNPAVPVPGAPEQYSNGNGPYGGPNVGGAVAGCSAVGDTLAATYVNCGKFGEGPVPSTSALTCPLAQVSVGTAPGGTSKIGVFRPGASGTGSSFLEDTTGANAYIPGSSRFIANFLTGNFNGVTPLATDIAVAGDWTGDGHGKIGIYRPTTGQWFLDINNNGIYDAGDATYNYGGIAGDLPVTGDWTGIGKTCIGIFRQGFFWIIDQNCNGTFDAADATFPFGGITNDVPVTGAWTGTTTKVGVVRAYAPGGVVGPCTAASTVGCPFYWVLDSAATNAGSSAAVHQPAAGSFPYGGLFGDKFVTGDWLGTGTWRAGIYRSGNWIEDTTGAHTYDTFYQFGGVPNDQPIVAKW